MITSRCWNVLTAMTTPMESDRVAQKMSDTHIKPKHLCIWVTSRGHIWNTTWSKSTLAFEEISLYHTSKNNQTILPLMTFPPTLMSVAQVCVCVGVRWNEPLEPLLCESSRVCRCPMASAAPSCSQLEQVTNWYHLMGSSIVSCFFFLFSLSPSRTWCDWEEHPLQSDV